MRKDEMFKHKSKSIKIMRAKRSQKDCTKRTCKDIFKGKKLTSEVRDRIINLMDKQ